MKQTDGVTACMKGLMFVSVNMVLTPQEVADILKISKNTVYELIKRGQLNGYRVGNKVRVDLKDVEAYKNSTKSFKSETPVAVSSAVEPAHQSMAESFSSQAGAFVICGQDIMLDILSRMLTMYTNASTQVLRSYEGSYNGLYALYNNEVQVATAHLWDSETNLYNTPYVRCMLPGTPAVIYRLAGRMQGFYVAKGNPKGIVGWEDLRRPDLSIVNREKGSGTRVLLDEHMRILGLKPSDIRGYNRESLTHLAVAGIVGRGGADFAIGSEKVAAQVSDVDFIPLQQECYDLIIKKENLNGSLFENLIKIIRSDEFKQELLGIGGYDLSETGALIGET
jgi:putative molybdopterin biosynthesis protein